MLESNIYYKGLKEVEGVIIMLYETIEDNILEEDEIVIDEDNLFLTKKNVSEKESEEL